MTIEKVGPPAAVIVDRKARICGVFEGADAATVNTTVFELRDEFETITSTDPAVAISLAGTEAAIVSQLLPEAQGVMVEGVGFLLPKCTIEAVESSWPLKSRLNPPLPAGRLVGEIEVMDGAEFIEEAIEPPQLVTVVHAKSSNPVTNNESIALCLIPHPRFLRSAAVPGRDNSSPGWQTVLRGSPFALKNHSETAAPAM
jgi:hypothetical protein